MKKSPAVIFMFLFVAPLILSAGCAPLIKSIPSEPVTFSRADEIISGIKAQNDMIRSFYSLGIVSIKGWMLDSDADILIAGVRDPLTLKIEITHTWGRPVLHILLRDGKIQVLSFQEKQIYSGIFTPEALSRFLPGLSMDREMIWSILSGRPPVVSHDALGVSGTDRIQLYDETGLELEAVYLPLEGSFPKKVVLPAQYLNISFSDIRENSEIPYAGEIQLSGERLEKDLTLRIKNTVLNASVPDLIFTLEIPSNYIAVDLDQ
ncbi:MAG: hypothetical protein JW944_05245 [Deltaproteobacteria bacterium]|nr:hypothetical protein [Deltaproteobacteria bacterium]